MDIVFPSRFIPFVLAASMIFAGCIQAGPSVRETIAPAQAPAAPETGIAQAPDREAMVAFVGEAVAYAKEHGRTAALAEFSNRSGSFVRGELYIYAYDFNGTTIAHPVNPEKIGVNRYDERDPTGTYFIRNLQGMAINGSGFVTYSYINPAHGNAVELKLGYVSRVDDTWWLGSGIYLGTP